jgi:hypothetical protein
MHNKKYQFFVSSTYTDLVAERAQVFKAILELGHIPVGMEMFSASNESQWSIITEALDSADYYIVIVGHRYGSTTKSGISYTEKEYDYAQRAGVPILGFVINENAPWPSNKTESAATPRQRLESFREKVKNRPVSFWSNKDELHRMATTAMVKAMASHPRSGWLRGSSSAMVSHGSHPTLDAAGQDAEPAVRIDRIVSSIRALIPKVAQATTTIDVGFRLDLDVDWWDNSLPKWFWDVGRAGVEGELHSHMDAAIDEMWRLSISPRYGLSDDAFPGALVDLDSVLGDLEVSVAACESPVQRLKEALGTMIDQVPPAFSLPTHTAQCAFIPGIVRRRATCKSILRHLPAIGQMVGQMRCQVAGEASRRSTELDGEKIT